jgi:hypothetical protein
MADWHAQATEVRFALADEKRQSGTLIGQRRFSTSIAVIRGFQWYSILYGSGFTRLDSIWIDPEVVKFPDFGFGV